MRATEGQDATVQLNVDILMGDLRRDVVVMVATEDGTAIGKKYLIYRKQINYHYLALIIRYFLYRFCTIRQYIMRYLRSESNNYGKNTTH